MRQDTTKSDRGPYERVQFLIATDGKLKVTGRDTLDFQVFGRVTGKLEDFGSKVFENGGDVDGSCEGGMSVAWHRTELNLRQLGFDAAASGKTHRKRHTLGTDTHLVLSVVLEESLDTTAGELNVRDLLAKDSEMEHPLLGIGGLEGSVTRC